jgi:hypothetical protein
MVTLAPNRAPPSARLPDFLGPQVASSAERERMRDGGAASAEPDGEELGGCDNEPSSMLSPSGTCGC